MLKMFSNGNARIAKMWFSRLTRRTFAVSSKTLVDAAAKEGELRVFLVAGEVSGDCIGSRLMASLKKLSPFPIKFAGIGGLKMSNQGLKSLFPLEDLSVMGIWELLPHLNKFRVKLKETVEAAVLFRPHAVVTIDSKGFSFRLLKQLRAKYVQRGVVSALHFHYVAPSFWAWKGGEARIRGLTEFVDHVLCILPFEENVCRLSGLNATFVGHPVLEDLLEYDTGKDLVLTESKGQVSREGFGGQYGVPPGATIVSLLPGSRMQEVMRMLPIFSEAVKLLKGSFSNLSILIHVAPNQLVENYISRVIDEWPTPVVLIPGASLHLKFNAFSASRVALCTSGTVAVELLLARLPCVVTYRAHFLTEWIIRFKAKIPYISLPNILLNSAIIPEALFEACTPERLASLIMDLMQNESLRQKQDVAAEKVLELLQPSNGNIIRQQDATSKRIDNAPSMFAASTILYKAMTSRSKTDSFEGEIEKKGQELYKHRDYCKL